VDPNGYRLGSHQGSRRSGVLRQTNPIRARWAGKTVAKAGGLDDATHGEQTRKTNPICPATPDGTGPQGRGTWGESCNTNPIWRGSGGSCETKPIPLATFAAEGTLLIPSVLVLGVILLASLVQGICVLLVALLFTFVGLRSPLFRPRLFACLRLPSGSAPGDKVAVADFPEEG
jgi:hypothetical protein